MLMAGALVLFAALVCLGFGLFALRLLERLRPGLSRGVTIGDLGILGYAVLGIIATVANVFMPLAGVVAGATCLLGIGMLAAWRGDLLRRGQAFGWSGPATLLMLATACFFLGAMIPGSTQAHYDTGLYHLQAVRLAMEYPLILGAGNIHMRFGYNSSLFPTAAMLSGGVFGMAGAITINAVLTTFVSLGVLQRAGAEGDGRALRSSVFGLLAAGLVVFTPLVLLKGWSGTPNTDVSSGLLVLYAFHLALRLSDLDGWQDAAPERGALAVLLAAVAALAVTIKLSALPVALLLVLVLMAWRRGRIAGRDVGVAIAVALVIGLPWLLRGIATSGCLAYPEPASCLPVPWRTAEALARSDIDWMRAWARRPETLPEIVLADWSWFPDWLASLPREPMRGTFVVLAAIAALLLAARLAVRRLVTAAALPPAPRRADIALLMGVAFAGIAFWFFSAPLVRYGQTWIALPLLLVIAQCAPAGWARDGGAAAVPAAALAMLARPRLRGGIILLLTVGALYSLATERPRSRLLDTGYARMPEVAVVQRAVLAGIPVHMPQQGNQCWDAPRLCTPHFQDRLAAARFLWTWIVRDPS